MKASRGIVALIGLVVLLAAVMAARPGWLVEPPHTGGAKRWALEYFPPDDRSLAIRQRLDAKQAVIERLLSGETTLLVAAAWFSRIDPHPAGELSPCRDDGERHCRLVIRWAWAELQTRQGAGDAEARVALLEKELADHIAAHGGVKFPPLDGLNVARRSPSSGRTPPPPTAIRTGVFSNAARGKLRPEACPPSCTVGQMAEEE
jgi:hypothetical protein